MNIYVFNTIGKPFQTLNMIDGKAALFYVNKFVLLKSIPGISEATFFLFFLNLRSMKMT